MDFFTTFKPTPTPGNGPVKDGRVVFDPDKKRFFMAFQTWEEIPHLLIAVSVSEDPSDGWLNYVDDMTQPESANNKYYGPANGQDYMELAVNDNFFLISNRMSHMIGTYPYPQADLNNPWQPEKKFTRHFMYKKLELIGARPIVRFMWQDDMPTGAVPCTCESTSPDTFWVSRDLTSVTVWGNAD